MTKYSRPTLDEPYIFERYDPINDQNDVYEWLTKVEYEHGVDKEVGTTSKCESGGVYQTVGWTIEGNPIRAHGDMSSIAAFQTPKLAWAMWVEAFRIYKRGGFKIYWRKKPQMHQISHGFAVYSRVYVAPKKEDN